MDSNSFLSGSLDKLSKRLVDDGHNMDLLKASKLCRDDEEEFGGAKSQEPKQPKAKAKSQKPKAKAKAKSQVATTPVA